MSSRKEFNRGGSSSMLPIRRGSLIPLRRESTLSNSRKRRPDLFGNPSCNARNPKRPLLHLNRFDSEIEDDESDLTQYLSIEHQKGPRNIFTEEGNEEDDDEKQAIARVSILRPSRSPQEQIRQPNQLISSPSLLQKQQNDMIFSPLSDALLPPIEMPRQNTKSDIILPLCNYAEEEFPDIYQSFTPSPLPDNITLSDYLSDAGITLNGSLIEQAVAAASTLPQLELYQSGCIQINESIQSCKEAIKKIHKSISAANLQFFADYNNGTDQHRLKMNQQFENIKDYARIKAVSICHKWWSNILQESLKTQGSNHEKFLQVEQLMTKSNTNIRRRMPLIIQYQKDVLKRLLDEIKLANGAELFRKCSEITSWKLEKAEHDMIEVTIHQDINVTVDCGKLQQKKADAVVSRMLNSCDRELGPLAELIHGLPITIQDKWDINEIIQSIAIYWNRVKMMLLELEKIQKSFDVDIAALNTSNTPEKAGFICKIYFLYYMEKTKYTLSFQVTPKDILNYPFIEMFSFKDDSDSECTKHRQLEKLLQKSISETGFTDLAGTLMQCVTTPL